MEFLEIGKEEFQKFVDGHPQSSFMQAVELGNLKEELGDKVYYFGVKEKKKIVAATLILEEGSIMGHKTFYAPRGFLIDYHNYELLKFFINELVKIVKSKKGFRITIDPNVVYRYRSSDGDIISDEKDDELIINLEKLGFKHFGFNIYLEALQVRWEYRLKLDKTYEELKEGFSKTTRKNIELCYKKGLMVRKGKIEDLATLSEIFDSTAKRKDFQIRSLSYYQKMYKHMHDLMTIYIAYLDPKKYYESTLDLLKIEEANNKEILVKMSKDMVGNKLTNQKETSDRLIEKYKAELEKAETFKKEFPNGKDIAVLLSMKSGDEYLTLNSGALEEYKDFKPKYAMYNEHIKDALEMGYRWVDFYGITGCFDKNDKYYGIYEIKKGFGGNVAELVGQFELKTGFMYHVYNLGKKIKKIIKR